MRSTSIGFAILLTSSMVAAQCIAAPGTAITVNQDSITGPNAIGFAFPFAGATYTDIHISDHGICFLTNGGVPAIPTATPLVYTPVASSMVVNGPVICPFWSDTTPGIGGTFFIDAQPTECTITWVDVESFGFPTPLMTFQMKLSISGQIEFIYGPTVTNNSTFGGVSDNGVVGVSPGTPATLPAASSFVTNPTTANNTFFSEYITANSFDMAGDSLLLIPTSPGWVAIHTNGGANCAFVETYGVGCDGLVLTSTDPVLGTQWDLTTSGLDPISVVGFTFFAFGRANPSVTLLSLGLNAPGCESHLPLAGILTRLISATSGGTFIVSVNVPNNMALAGESFTNQSIGISSLNVAGLSTSNGLQCTMGL